MPRVRLDVLLVEKELASSRDEAQRLIRAGQVLVHETRIEKPGEKVDAESPVRVRRRETPFASRGGIKLQHALEGFGIDVRGMVAADLGASNGGFTDCLLQRGASRVFAIDVGYGQLAHHLQNDERVCVMDRTNCRHLDEEKLGERVDLVTGDLSFISIRKITPSAAAILKPGGMALLLIKPQFEIGKGRVGKKGIVRNADDHLEVLQTCYTSLTEEGWSLLGARHSSITGKTGNIEFWFWMDRSGNPPQLRSETLPEIVSQAHREIHPQSS